MSRRFLLLFVLLGCSSSAEPTPGSASGSAASASASAPARSSASQSVAPAPPAPSGSAASPPEPEKREITISTGAGDVVVHSVQHGTVYIEADGKVLWLDPYSEGKLDDKPKADFILVTDNHQDHYDVKAIEAVKKDGTQMMGPKVVMSDIEGATVIANGEKKQLGPFMVEAIPMYNERRGPEAGKKYHDKGRGNGYVLEYGGKRIYFSGDTECIPEMKALKDIEVAFVCMNLPYTMTPEEASECIAAFKPKIVVPYHYRGQNPDEMKPELDEAGVKIERLRFY